MTPLISIIVPVYNVRDYLEECINSILNQSYTNWELILIDDGSTDGSTEICDSSEKNDIRIKVYHRSNQGVSSVRNFGVAVSKGEFIMFVDSDDCLHKDGIALLLTQLLTQNADFIMSPIKRGNTPCYIIDNKKVIHLTPSEAMKTLLSTQSLCSPCGKLIKKQLLVNSPFPENQRYEDLAIMHQIIHASKQILYTENIIYFYRDRKGSFLDKGFSLQQLYRVSALHQRSDFIHDNYPELYKYAFAQYIGGLALAAHDLYLYGNTIDYPYYADFIRKIKMEWYQIIYNQDLGKKEYLFTFLVKVNRRLFEVVCKIIK